MIAIEVKGRGPKFTWEIVGIYRAAKDDMRVMERLADRTGYPLSYGVPVRERYGSTLQPATREQHDQNCTQSH